MCRLPWNIVERVKKALEQCEIFINTVFVNPGTELYNVIKLEQCSYWGGIGRVLFSRLHNTKRDHGGQIWKLICQPLPFLSLLALHHNVTKALRHAAKLYNLILL